MYSSWKNVARGVSKIIRLSLLVHGWIEAQTQYNTLVFFSRIYMGSLQGSHQD